METIECLIDNWLPSDVPVIFGDDVASELGI